MKAHTTYINTENQCPGCIKQQTRYNSYKPCENQADHKAYTYSDIVKVFGKVILVLSHYIILCIVPGK